MLNNHLTAEEEKVDIQGNINHYKTSNNTNYNLDTDVHFIINNNDDKDNNNDNINSSPKNLNSKHDLNNEQINNNSNKNINPKTINDNNNNNNVFKEIKITNKINKTDNKNLINEKDNKDTKVITLNKEDLYNAFILFQQLNSKYKNDNENNEEYIKNKLFEFVSMKKNPFFSETIECNVNYDDNENENIFDVQNYMPIYCKSDKDVIVNNHINENNNNNINLIKSYSFSFNLNDKNKILNNYLYTFLNDPKDTIKSNSQIFNEYLLLDRKIKEKTISHENSKSFHHNYSFDLKHKDKTELSFNSIPEKEKENDKEHDKDKYSDLENNNIINKYNFDNYNSYEKEIEHKSPFNNNDYQLFGKSHRKYSAEEDLLIDPVCQKNKKINVIEFNENQNDENNINNLCNKKSSINEKIRISPSKQETNNIESFNNDNNNNNKCSENQQSAKNIPEIKVNKNKLLNNKEQIINEKIKELNDEILKFKEETNKVTLLKEEYEKMQAKLIKDIKELNLKKQISQKNYKGTPQSELKLIMSITQHNQALILNNNKKKETIKLLRERIYELENIIKAKNNPEHTNQKNIFKKINNFDKNYYGTERVNIFTKKRNKNIKKKKNESYNLKRARINLKKKVESNSSEKIKDNIKNNYTSEIINQTMNNNINHNLNKIFLENKNMLKTNNNNKKLMNVSYNHQNLKNNILNSKLQNYNNSNNNYKKCFYNVGSNKNFGKKNHLLNNNTNMNAVNNRNNSINSGVLNNVNKLKIDNPVIHTNLYIYEKLINKEREKEKNYKKINININSERDVGGHKKVIKELKTETEKNKNEKDKKSNINSHLFDKNNFKKYQKSQGKNLMTNRLDLKTDIYKNKSNINILSSYKLKPKNLSINKKNMYSIRPLTRNTTNLSKNDKSREKIKNNLKEINNSLDIKNLIKDTITHNLDLDDENDLNGYDFVIPEIYKKNSDSEIINTVEQDGKIINIYDNNKKEIIFKSGVRKEIYMDGYQLVHFPNGDMKQKFVGKEEKVIYYYSETNTVQTTFKNGLNIFKFSNGQIEKHYPDGSKFIIYTNGIKRKISKNGTEEVYMPNEKNKEEDNKKNDLNNENENDKNIINNTNEDKNNLLLSFMDIEK